MSEHTATEGQAFHQERRAIAENKLLFSSMRPQILQLLDQLNENGDVRGMKPPAARS